MSAAVNAFSMSSDLDPLMGYCGLYCGDCFNHKGEIADQARDLRKKLREEHFDNAATGLSKFFKDFNDYEKCYNVLGAMVKLRCSKGCRNGRGPHCTPGMCSIKKGYAGCWECGEFEDCKKLKFLDPIHGDGHLKNLRNIRKKGVEGFIQGKRYW
jgi:hypothetical protein